MKVLALVILALGSASARGSGPYLPSGWRPDGPAFFLPIEAKPAENPLKDVILQGSEASGSDALREYGPPKVAEVSQDLVQQGLPDEATEKQFEVINVNVDAVEADVNAEEVSPIVESQENPSTVAEAIVPIVVFEPTTESDAGIINEVTVSEIASESPQDSDSSNSISVSQELVKSEEVSATESITAVEAAEQVVEGVQKIEIQEEIQQVEQEVQNIESAVQNVPDALAYLENGIKQVELAQAQLDAAVLENSGSLPQAPEGFLEYGPPGFREYGPPKNELAQISSEGLSIGEAFESTNEARRRRFSPKFRSTKQL